MKEDFLHYVWQHGLFNHKQLLTTTGLAVTVIHPGRINTDAGPDFFNAKVKLEKEVWAGNVEIHIRCNDWYRHKHHLDKAYDNVILHITFDNDAKPVTTASGRTVPSASLKHRIPIRVMERYQGLQVGQNRIPCEPFIGQVRQAVINLWLGRLGVERIEDKTEVIKEIWITNKRDWNETFYQCIASHFGMKVNNEAFLRLARSIPLKILAKHKTNLPQIEGLVVWAGGSVE